MLLNRNNIPREFESITTQLFKLATDLRWTWSHAGDALWQLIDETTWKATRNPYVILQKLSITRLTELVNESQFEQQLQASVNIRENYLNRSCWADRYFPRNSQRESIQAKIAYFSMEFGLGEALPIYAGGLGILAGDHLKASSDLGVPLIGIGLLYDQGYFHQYLDNEGWQREAYSYNDSRNMPLQPVLKKDGAWLTIDIAFPGRTVHFRIWQVQVGRTLLFLLDSNDPLNNPIDQGITGRLYDGSKELRLAQEIVLGIGGWRIIEALELPIEICHLNEGHAAFATIERAHCFKEKNKVNFFQALWATRAGNIFTTHTPIAAAFDTFSPDLLRYYGQQYVESLGIEPEYLLGLGRKDSKNFSEQFNMAYLAANTCSKINGVSCLHGEVSRRIFSELFPRWPVKEIPISHITNGVHMPSWDSREANTIWKNRCGKDRWFGTQETLCDAIKQVSDKDLWNLRNTERTNLVHYTRRRLTNQLSQNLINRSRSFSPEQLQNVLDPNTLTLGFARRFAEYKRPNLLLYDQDRFIRLLNNAEMPVQIVVAGKAHPENNVGKRFIRDWANFVKQPQVRSKAVFLEDYDIALAKHLVQGVDVWINTPRRPWEACGTSGMKVLVNGGINVSELDGWWAEAYSSGVGWALGDGNEHQDNEWDATDADQLYELLEQEVVPMFYARNDKGLPNEWLQTIRRSMSELTPRFSSNRMVREYTEKIYVPARLNFNHRTVDNAALAKTLHQWKTHIDQHWDEIYWGDLAIYNQQDFALFKVSIFLGEIPPDSIKMQLFSESNSEQDSIQEMVFDGEVPGLHNWFTYSVRIQTSRQLHHFTPRICAFHCDLDVPLEANMICWWSGNRIIHK